MSQSVPFSVFDWHIDFTIAPDAVLERWCEYIADAAPWRTMPADDLMGYVGAITIAVLGAEQDPDERRRILALHDAAIRHADFRRAQCCDRRVVVRDLVALEAAIRATVEGSNVEPSCADLLVGIAAAEMRRVRRSVRRAYRRR